MKQWPHVIVVGATNGFAYLGHFAVKEATVQYADWETPAKERMTDITSIILLL